MEDSRDPTTSPKPRTQMPQDLIASKPGMTSGVKPKIRSGKYNTQGPGTATMVTGGITTITTVIKGIEIENPRAEAPAHLIQTSPHSQDDRDRLRRTAPGTIRKTDDRSHYGPNGPIQEPNIFLGPPSLPKLAKEPWGEGQLEPELRSNLETTTDCVVLFINEANLGDSPRIESNISGKFKIKAILDSGSEVNLMSEGVYEVGFTNTPITHGTCSDSFRQKVQKNSSASAKRFLVAYVLTPEKLTSSRFGTMNELPHYRNCYRDSVELNILPHLI
jgi:hypothetical protein